MINLKTYTEKLDVQIEFYREIKDATGVSINTARNWCKFDTKTDDPKHLAILSQLTGIAEKNLFKGY